MSIGLVCFFALTGTAVCTSVLLPIARRVCLRFGFVDKPDGLLKLQQLTVPYGGGAAAVIAACMTCRVLHICPPAPIVVAAAVLLVTGIVDDRKGISPGIRLAIELLAGVSLIHAWFPGLAWPKWTLALAGCVLSAASINAYNMTDGTDALAGIVGTCVLGGLSAGWLFAHNVALAAVAAAVCGGLLIFLVFNWPPARVYLGNAGAYCLGFLFVVLCIPAIVSWPAMVGIACIMAPLEVELVASVVRRATHRQPLLAGDRNHTYDVMLRQLHLTSRELIFWYLASGLLGSTIGVLVWQQYWPWWAGAVWIILLCGSVFALYSRDKLLMGAQP